MRYDKVQNSCIECVFYYLTLCKNFEKISMQEFLKLNCIEIFSKKHFSDQWSSCQFGMLGR